MNKKDYKHLFSDVASDLSEEDVQKILDDVFFMKSDINNIPEEHRRSVVTDIIDSLEEDYIDDQSSDDSHTF